MEIAVLSRYGSRVVESFKGKLTLQDGTVVVVMLSVADDTLRIVAEHTNLGAWPLKYCRVARVSETEFTITIDGEPTTFEPADAYRFGKEAAERFHGSSLAERINVVRDMPLASTTVELPVEDDEPFAPDPVPASEPRVPLTIAAAVVAAAALITLGGMAVFNQQPNVDTVVVVTTTATTLPPGPAIFTLTPEGFRSEWNVVAARFGGAFTIGVPFEREAFQAVLSPQVLLTGKADADGTLQEVKLAISPTDQPDQTEFALATIGIAIATADPSLDSAARIRIVRDLGFATFPEVPLEGIDGETEENGIRYGLLYIDVQDDADDLLIFSFDEP